MKTNRIVNIIKASAFALLTGVISTSCLDQLEEETYGKYSADTYFDTTAKMEMAVNGVYETFSSIATYGQYWQVYGDCDTDIAHVKGAGTGHVARDLGHYNAYAEHSWLQESWGLYYQGIDRANTILDQKNNVVINGESDQLVFNRLVAQTKCMRAMCYLDLVRLWGDVPLKLDPSKDGDNFKLPKTDRDEVYAQIITDLKEAIPDLLWCDDSNQKGERLSKGAAMGLLARAYLFRGGYSLHQDKSITRPANYKEYYQAAQSILNELITSGKHGLIDADGTYSSGYEKNFRNMCELKYDPFENICEISFYTPTGENAGASNMGTYNGPEINVNSIYGRANSFIKTQKFFYETFDAKDLRRDVAVATFSINANSKIVEIAEKNSQTWSPGKWRRNWQTAAIKNNNNTDVNFPLLRYADVLLMSAEVENELNDGPNDLAIERVNQVHRRAFGKPYLTTNADVDLKISDFTGKDDFFKFIVAERGRELCFEGIRRLDLIRWNLLKETVATTYQNFLNYYNGQEGLGSKYAFEAGSRFVSGKHELYPIPAREVRETLGSVSQNPGY